MNRARWFPDPPRDFPFRRALRTTLRALHILCGGVLLGAYLFQQPAETVHLWLALAIASGVLMFFTDLHATLAVLFEWRGVIVLVKLILLVLVAWYPDFAVLLLTLILMLGTFISHVSRKIRHRLWWNPGFVVQSDQRRG